LLNETVVLIMRANIKSVWNAKSDGTPVQLVDAVRAHLKKPDKKPLHFRDLRHEHRLVFVDAISQAALKTVTVLVHKPSLKEPEKFQERYRLYYYSVRNLLERVSWSCRDHRAPHDAGDGSAEIVFSNRSGMSYADLREYMAKLKRQGEAMLKQTLRRPRTLEVVGARTSRILREGGRHITPGRCGIKGLPFNT
jgi:hypothetical protein